MAGLASVWHCDFEDVIPTVVVATLVKMSAKETVRIQARLPTDWCLSSEELFLAYLMFVLRILFVCFRLLLMLVRMIKQ